jgi:hypothetical protein
MKYKGLAVQMEAFEFSEDLHVTNANECEVDFDLNVKVLNGQIVSMMDMQYYRTQSPLTPLASLRTSMKLWVSPNIPDVSCSERVLYSLKMQHRYSCFMLYQKLKPLNLQNFYLPTPSDEDFFKVVKSQTMADLIFDVNGKYTVSF